MVLIGVQLQADVVGRGDVAVVLDDAVDLDDRHRSTTPDLDLS